MTGGGAKWFGNSLKEWDQKVFEMYSEDTASLEEGTYQILNGSHCALFNPDILNFVVTAAGALTPAFKVMMMMIIMTMLMVMMMIMMMMMMMTVMMMMIMRTIIMTMMIMMVLIVMIMMMMTMLVMMMMMLVMMMMMLVTPSLNRPSPNCTHQ